MQSFKKVSVENVSLASAEKLEVFLIHRSFIVLDLKGWQVHMQLLAAKQTLTLGRESTHECDFFPVCLDKQNLEGGIQH